MIYRAFAFCRRSLSADWCPSTTSDANKPGSGAAANVPQQQDAAITAISEARNWVFVMLIKTFDHSVGKGKKRGGKEFSS